MIFLSRILPAEMLSPGFDPMYLMWLPVAIGILLLIAYRLYDKYFENEPDENFRLEIVGYSNNKAGAGLYMGENLKGKEISAILRTAIPLLCIKNPDMVKLLLFHCIASLEGDEDINKAFIKFQKEISRSVSRV
ncbi:MAG: hypothetical protein WBA74_23165 [Cyclobacteriaceae bacterium]